MNILGCQRLHGRESRARSTAVNLAKTALQVLIFWGFFLGVMPTAIVRVERALGAPSFASPLWFSVGLALFAVLSLLGLWCALIFSTLGRGTPLPMDTTTRLVIVGPYRFVRNPMALAGIGQGFAVGLMIGSPTTLAYAVLGAFAWQYLARPWEEADLERRFGAPYAAYRRAVACWLPTLRPYPRRVEGHTPSALGGLEAEAIRSPRA